MNNIKPYLPHYIRPPNKFLRYEQERFDDGCGHTATLNIAVFFNKNKSEERCVAQVIWNA